MSKDDVLQQNLEDEAKYSGVYMIWLLFREKVQNPSTEVLVEKLKERFGGVDIVAKDDALRSFALLEHTVTYKDEQRLPSQVMLSECGEVNKPFGDSVDRSQFWDCPNGAEILDACPWQVMVSDFLAGGLLPKERANILADWLEVCLELYPECEAVYFAPSRKLLKAEHVRQNPYADELRWFYGGVNARFFKIQGTEDMLVDTLGLYALGLPDVQYHFHGLDPDAVVNHAYNTAIYQFLNDAPIESGHTIGGIAEGMSWRCQYENALIQPVREVLDIVAGASASGRRTKA